MSINDIFLKRQSIRSFSSKPIPQEVLVELLEAAKIAPSAVNNQPWHFFVCSSPDIQEKIRHSYQRIWFQSAQQYIVACADNRTSWKRPVDNKNHSHVDVAIATTHLILKATEVGIGTCWVCNFDPSVLEEALQLDKELEPIAIIALGYPKERPDTEREVKRKSLKEIVTWL